MSTLNPVKTVHTERTLTAVYGHVSFSLWDSTVWSQYYFSVDTEEEIQILFDSINVKNRRAEKTNDTTGVTNKFQYAETVKDRTQTVEWGYWADIRWITFVEMKFISVAIFRISDLRTVFHHEVQKRLWSVVTGPKWSRNLRSRSGHTSPYQTTGRSNATTTMSLTRPREAGDSDLTIRNQLLGTEENHIKGLIDHDT